MLIGTFLYLNGGDDRMVIASNKRNFIEVHMSELPNVASRFPNKMIWDINSYLTHRFQLYQYYYSKTPSNPYAISMSNIHFVDKYLCFVDLHPTYIQLTDFDIEEYTEEFEKHVQEFDNYQQFFECYSMEQIDEMSYVATADLSKLVEQVSLHVKGLLFKREHRITKLVDSYSDVSIHIGDHDYMTICSKHPDIVTDLLKIIKSYE